MTTELGVGGSAIAATTAIAIDGCRNLLRAAGVLEGVVQARPIRWLDMPGAVRQ